ncbi:hypothetical protein MettiDRAFT_2377 [Methanolobus tindarius DSM 2278]|uniref:Uncharacterized protein n=1 Tax=Methanolobus tindarius DSM 2278 TaxID=1090322 RepID=W9DQM7_METTI|nr:hypothetical protein [Methanolobus tindarius]ETA68889.1 hypothetical protein MettiDRAFT_2377 [Methanolobus tindarius DSM 2278]
MIITANSTFQGLVSWTDGHDSLLTLFFTAVVAAATVVYAILTWKLVSETRKMRKVQTEPHISIIIQPREDTIGFIDLIVQNIGLGPAYDVKFDIEPDFDLMVNRKLSEVGFFKYGLKYFAPDERRKLFLTSTYENYEEKIKTKIRIVAKYTNGAGTDYSSTYMIDFSEMEGMISAGKPPIYEISDSLGKIRSELHDFRIGNPKFSVIAYSEDEYEQKNIENRERRNKFRNQSHVPKWGERLPFEYEGSIKEGNIIEVGNEEVSISSLQYYDLLCKFRGKTVNIGLPDSNDVIPNDSLGAWLRDNVRRIPLAAYVGPILVKEGYAEKGDDVAFITFKQEYPTDS